MDKQGYVRIYTQKQWANRPAAAYFIGKLGQTPFIAGPDFVTKLPLTAIMPMTYFGEQAPSVWNYLPYLMLGAQAMGVQLDPTVFFSRPGLSYARVGSSPVSSFFPFHTAANI